MALTKISGEVIQDGIVISGIVTATEFEGNLTGTASTATASSTAYGLSGAPDIVVGITTATGFVGDVTGNITGNVTGNINSTGISTVTTLSATSIVGINTVGITSAYIEKVYTTSGIDITNNIVQVVTSKWDTTGSGSAYITSTSYTDSGASVSITPKISGSTMIITVNGRLGSSYASFIDHNWQIRDTSGSVLPNYTNDLEFIQRLETGSGTSYMFMQVYDTNVTSAQTYKLYGKQSGGNGIFIFQPVVFTVMEVRV
jgi:hypothetical protein